LEDPGFGGLRFWRTSIRALQRAADTGSIETIRWLRYSRRSDSENLASHSADAEGLISQIDAIRVAFSDTGNLRAWHIGTGQPWS
jgi:hypothetical protein